MESRVAGHETPKTVGPQQRACRQEPQDRADLEPVKQGDDDACRCQKKNGFLIGVQVYRSGHCFLPVRDIVLLGPSDAQGVNAAPGGLVGAT